MTGMPSGVGNVARANWRSLSIVERRGAIVWCPDFDEAERWVEVFSIGIDAWLIVGFVFKTCACGGLLCAKVKDCEIVTFFLRIEMTGIGPKLKNEVRKFGH